MGVIVTAKRALIQYSITLHEHVYQLAARTSVPSKGCEVNYLGDTFKNTPTHFWGQTCEVCDSPVPTVY